MGDSSNLERIVLVSNELSIVAGLHAISIPLRPASSPNI